MNDCILLHQTNYNEDELYSIIKKSLEDLGYLNNIGKDNSVFIKLNCVGPFDTELAITTNPHILKVVIDIVKEKTTNITIGDNPATKDLIPTMKKCGLYNIAIESGVKILDQSDIKTIKGTKTVMFNDFNVSRQMVEADFLINLPKVKCHSLTYMSCAEKNFFGLIYGLNKSAWHTRANNPKDFAFFINDLYSTFLEQYEENHVIHICDGIIALEGDGPSTGGTPKEMDALIISKDAVACDLTACRVAHLDETRLSITQNALDRGIGSKEYNLIGNINDFNINLEPPKKSLPIKAFKLLEKPWIRSALLEHPSVDKDICIKCGECAKICPAKAMTFVKGVGPSLNKKPCIRCWCCAEVCPKNAISKSRRPLIGKILLK